MTAAKKIVASCSRIQAVWATALLVATIAAREGRWAPAAPASSSSATEGVGEMDAATAKTKLEGLEKRIVRRKAEGHSLAAYLRESADIIQRLIGYIEEDGARSDAFCRNEAALEKSECAMLLASLETELDLLDQDDGFAKHLEKMTVNARDLGARGDGTHDDGPALNAAIDKASALGPGARVSIPAGRYRIATLPPGEPRAHIPLVNRRDLTIEAEPGTTFIMTQVAPGVTIQGCRNVKLRNISIDYDPLPFTQGTIVAVDPARSAFEMEIQEGYPDPTEERFTKAPFLRGTMRDPKTGDIVLKAGDPRIAKVERVGPNRYRLTAKNNAGKLAPNLTEGFEVGCPFVLNARETPGGGAAVQIFDSGYVALENVWVHGSYTHAYLVRGAEGVKLRRGGAEPLPGSGRLACTDADGFHCASNRKGPFLEKCRFWRTNDDCANIYGKTYPLALVVNPLEILLDKSLGTERGGSDSSSLFRGGDTVAFIDPNTGEIAAVRQVVAGGSGAWKGRSNLQLRLDRPVDGLVSRDALGKAPVKGREYVHHQKGEPIEHFVVNLNAKGDGFIVQGCQWGHNRASGIKIKASNGVFETTRIEHPAGPCMSLKCSLDWQEAYFPRNIVVRGNTFANATGLTSSYRLPGQSNPGLRMNRRIRIENNEFLGASNRAISLNSAREAWIVNNLIDSPNPLSVVNCQDVHVTGNTFVRPDGDGASFVAVSNSEEATIEIGDNETSQARTEEPPRKDPFGP